MLRHFVSFICVSLCAFVLGAPTTRPPLCQTHGGSPCKFPFIYKGQRYTTCKTEDSPENAWCATVTGSDLTMTSWHYCTNPTCSRQDSTSPPAAPPNGTNFSTVNAQMARRCTTTEYGVPCRFPFEYYGITYHECTTVDYGDTLWCATGNDPSYTMVYVSVTIRYYLHHSECFHSECFHHSECFQHQINAVSDIRWISMRLSVYVQGKSVH